LTKDKKTDSAEQQSNAGEVISALIEYVDSSKPGGITFQDVQIAKKKKALIEKPILVPEGKVKTLMIGFRTNDLPFEEKYDIGSRKYVPATPTGVELVSWYEFPKKTLYDYHVLLADFSTMDDIDQTVRRKD
jgi:hypothetical protein